MAKVFLFTNRLIFRQFEVDQELSGGLYQQL